MKSRIVIVGGGLAGLHAAALLEERGATEYLVLEARTRFGGRIESGRLPVAVPASGAEPAAERFDLGATWFWPALQPELEGLVLALGLGSFPQDERGDMLVEQSVGSAPVRVSGHPSSLAGMRVQGSMDALIKALQRRVPPERLLAGLRVAHIRRQGDAVEIETIDTAGRVQAWHADQVLLALPPRLAASTIAFTPQLPGELARRWRGTPTWMAPHAKYLAVYDTPFWRERGLSGEARSGVGPLAEIHDASTPGGRGALFGFFGVPVQAREAAGKEVLLAHCRSQLARLFGAKAATPAGELLKDWTADACTATAADRQAVPDQPHPPPATVPSGPWQDRLVGIASEWSPQFPGYVAGALDAARRGVALTKDRT